MAIVIETELGTKQFEKQIAGLKADLERYMKVLESEAKIPVSLRMSNEEKQQLEITIEKTRNQLISLQEQAQRTGEEGKNAGEKSGHGFENGIKSLKRFALSLFGIRSAFSLVRRATSTYLSQHEDTANKINAIWVALGNALAPIIEAIADMVLKFIGYLNVFLQALGFDVDLTKNMNKSTKAINGTTKAMKELNNQVASFDEMNVAQKETSSGGGVGGGGIGGTNGFEMPELNQDIVKFLQDTAKWLKENWELLALIGGVIAGYKVAKWLGTLGSIIGGGAGDNATGLLGLRNILKGLLATELIAITISVIYYGMQLNELKKYNKEIEKATKTNTKGIDEVNKANLNAVKSYEKGSEAINKYVEEMKRENEQALTSIEAKKKENSEITGLNKVWDLFGGTTSKNNAIINENTQRLINNAQNLQQLANEGKLTDEQMKIYRDTMDYLNQTYDDMAWGTSTSTGALGDFSWALDDTKKDLYEQIEALKKADTTTQTTTNNQKNAYQSLREKVQSEMSKINGTTATTKIKADASQFQETLNKIGKTPSVASIIGAGLAYSLATVRLAKGGIINNPGRGVPLMGAIGGEATGGAEGVVPLNNEQSMQIIGETIAKYVNINFTNTTLLDGKVLTRTTNKVINQNNFATNGRGA